MIVQITQPVVPNYRLPLFDAIADTADLSIFLQACKSEPHGVISSVEERDYIDLNHSFIPVLNKRLLWQTRMNLVPEMSKGDVLVLCGNPRIVSNYKLIYQAKKKEISIVWWGHGLSAGSNPINVWLRRKIMHLADTILLYTDDEVKAYKKLGFKEEILFATNNTIDLAPVFNQTKKYNENDLIMFKIKNGLMGKKILLTVGRLTKKMNLRILFDALANSLLNSEDIILLVIGDGEEKQRLVDYAKNISIDHKIRWVGALYKQEELAPYYLVSDCFVYPGAIGLSLIQSFGYSLPVITHDNYSNQMPEIAALSNNVNGMLYKEGNEVSLSEKILLILNDRKLYDFLSYNALQQVKNKYSHVSMIQRVLDALNYASQCKK